MDNVKLKEKIEKLNPEDREMILDLIDGWNGKKFHLATWAPPKSNPEWSHDHCPICMCSISNLDEEKEGYADDSNFYWICKSCYKKYSEMLEL